MTTITIAPAEAMTVAALIDREIGLLQLALDRVGPDGLTRLRAATEGRYRADLGRLQAVRARLAVVLAAIPA